MPLPFERRGPTQETLSSARDYFNATAEQLTVKLTRDSGSHTWNPRTFTVRKEDEDISLLKSFRLDSASKQLHYGWIALYLLTVVGACVVGVYGISWLASYATERGLAIAADYLLQASVQYLGSITKSILVNIGNILGFCALAYERNIFDFHYIGEGTCYASCSTCDDTFAGRPYWPSSCLTCYPGNELFVVHEDGTGYCLPLTCDDGTCDRCLASADVDSCFDCAEGYVLDASSSSFGENDTLALITGTCVSIADTIYNDTCAIEGARTCCEGATCVSTTEGKQCVCGDATVCNDPSKRCEVYSDFHGNDNDYLFITLLENNPVYAVSVYMLSDRGYMVGSIIDEASGSPEIIVYVKELDECFVRGYTVDENLQRTYPVGVVPGLTQETCGPEPDCRWFYGLTPEEASREMGYTGLVWDEAHGVCVAVQVFDHRLTMYYQTPNTTTILDGEWMLDLVRIQIRGEGLRPVGVSTIVSLDKGDAVIVFGIDTSTYELSAFVTDVISILEASSAEGVVMLYDPTEESGVHGYVLASSDETVKQWMDDGYVMNAAWWERTVWGPEGLAVEPWEVRDRSEALVNMMNFARAKEGSWDGVSVPTMFSMDSDFIADAEDYVTGHVYAELSPQPVLCAISFDKINFFDFDDEAVLVTVMEMLFWFLFFVGSFLYGLRMTHTSHSASSLYATVLVTSIAVLVSTVYMKWLASGTAALDEISVTLARLMHSMEQYSVSSAFELSDYLVQVETTLFRHTFPGLLDPKREFSTKERNFVYTRVLLQMQALLASIGSSVMYHSVMLEVDTGPAFFVFGSGNNTLYSNVGSDGVVALSSLPEFRALVEDTSGCWREMYVLSEFGNTTEAVLAEYCEDIDYDVRETISNATNTRASTAHLLRNSHYGVTRARHVAATEETSRLSVAVDIDLSGVSSSLYALFEPFQQVAAFLIEDTPERSLLVSSDGQISRSTDDGGHQRLRAINSPTEIVHVVAEALDKGYPPKDLVEGGSLHKQLEVGYGIVTCVVAMDYFDPVFDVNSTAVAAIGYSAYLVEVDSWSSLAVITTCSLAVVMTFVVYHNTHRFLHYVSLMHGKDVENSVVVTNATSLQYTDPEGSELRRMFDQIQQVMGKVDGAVEVEGGSRIAVFTRNVHNLIKQGDRISVAMRPFLVENSKPYVETNQEGGAKITTLKTVLTLDRPWIGLDVGLRSERLSDGLSAPHSGGIDISLSDDLSTGACPSPQDSPMASPAKTPSAGLSAHVPSSGRRLSYRSEPKYSRIQNDDEGAASRPASGAIPDAVRIPRISVSSPPTVDICDISIKDMVPFSSPYDTDISKSPESPSEINLCPMSRTDVAIHELETMTSPGPLLRKHESGTVSPGPLLRKHESGTINFPGRRSVSLSPAVVSSIGERYAEENDGLVRLGTVVREKSDEEALLRPNAVRRTLYVHPISSLNEPVGNRAKRYILDGVQLRDVRTVLTLERENKLRYRSIYYFYTSKLYHRAVCLLYLSLVALAFFEAPNSSILHEYETDNVDSETAVLYAEGSILTLCAVDIALQVAVVVALIRAKCHVDNQNKGRHFWLFLPSSLLLILLTDWVYRMAIGGYHTGDLIKTTLPYTGVFRPLLVITRFDTLSLAFRNVVSTMMHAKDVFLLLMAFVGVASAMSLPLLSDVTAETNVYSDELGRSFADFRNVIASIFILASSGENYEDVVYPAVSNDGGQRVIFFFIVTFIGIYLFISLIIAMFQQQYTVGLERFERRRRRTRRRGIITAFLLLDDDESGAIEPAECHEFFQSCGTGLNLESPVAFDVEDWVHVIELLVPLFDTHPNQPKSRDSLGFGDDVRARTSSGDLSDFVHPEKRASKTSKHMWDVVTDVMKTMKHPPPLLGDQQANHPPVSEKSSSENKLVGEKGPHNKDTSCDNSVVNESAEGVGTESAPVISGGANVDAESIKGEGGTLQTKSADDMPAVHNSSRLSDATKLARLNQLQCSINETSERINFPASIIEPDAGIGMLEQELVPIPRGSENKDENGSGGSVETTGSDVKKQGAPAPPAPPPPPPPPPLGSGLSPPTSARPSFAESESGILDTSANRSSSVTSEHHVGSHVPAPGPFGVIAASLKWVYDCVVLNIKRCWCVAMRTIGMVDMSTNARAHAKWEAWRRGGLKQYYNRHAHPHPHSHFRSHSHTHSHAHAHTHMHHPHHGIRLPTHTHVRTHSQTHPHHHSHHHTRAHSHPHTHHQLPGRDSVKQRVGWYERCRRAVLFVILFPIHLISTIMVLLRRRWAARVDAVVSSLLVTRVTQLVTVTNIWVVYLVATPANVSAANVMLVMALVYHTAEVAAKVFARGTRRYWYDGDVQDRFVMWSKRFDAVVVSVTMLAFGFWAMTTKSIGDNGRFFLTWPTIRIFSVFPSIRTLAFGIFAAIPQIANVVGLLLLTMQAFGIVGCIMFAGAFYRLPDDSINKDISFDSMYMALCTLYQVMIGESWHEIMYAAIDSKTSLSVEFYFMSYVTVVGLLFANLFVGVVCNTYINLDKRVDMDRTNERAIQLLEHMKKRQQRSQKKAKITLKSTAHLAIKLAKRKSLRRR
eukprot:Rmarinus@m.24